MTTFEIIKKLANKRSKSLRQVAFDLELGENYLYSLKNGKRPGTETLEKLANYFNVSVDYLLGRDDSFDNIDIDKALDNAMSYDGKPLTEHDRNIIKNLLKTYMENK